MSFKSWILENVDYVWDSANKKWDAGISINIPTDISISLIKVRGINCIDINNSSPNNPRLTLALQQLIKIKPFVVDYLMIFDGFNTNQTVKEFLTKEVEDIPQIVYTGTSSNRWAKIAIEGLKPRSQTGSNPVYGKHMPSQEDKVYFAVTIGNTVKFAAREAGGDGSDPLILAISTDAFLPSQFTHDPKGSGLAI